MIVTLTIVMIVRVIVTMPGLSCFRAKFSSSNLGP